MLNKLLVVFCGILFFFTDHHTYGKDLKFKVNLAISTSPQDEFYSSIILSPYIRAEYYVAKDWFLNFDIGATFLNLKRKNLAVKNRIDISNIGIGAGYYFSDKEKKFEHIINLTAYAPLAFYRDENITDKRISEYNYLSNIASRGWQQPYPWLMNSAPMVLNLETKYNLNTNYSIIAKVSPALIIPINSRPLSFSNCFELETIYSIEDYRVSFGFNNYYNSKGIENLDKYQNSIFIGNSFNFDENILKLKLNLNIDSPYGVMAEDPKTNWGAVVEYEF